DRVRARLGTKRVERLRRYEAEPAPLPGGEAPVPLVAADLGAVLVHELARFAAQPVARQELAVVAAREEAGLLALGARCDGQAGRLRLRPHLLLRAFAERERDAREEPRVEAAEHVRLVLPLVGGAREEPPAPVVGDARVVARHEPLCAGAPREGEELREAEGAVAAHARVGR